jgi:hypothetical protein
MHACKVHAYKMHAYKVHACKVHAGKIYFIVMHLTGACLINVYLITEVNCKCNLAIEYSYLKSSRNLSAAGLSTVALRCTSVRCVPAREYAFLESYLW